MKCNHCGKEIDAVLVHRFTCDGADTQSLEPILGGEPGTCFYLDIDRQASMFEFEDSPEDFKNTIWCPECGKFPFKGSVAFYNRAHVVFDAVDCTAVEPCPDCGDTICSKHENSSEDSPAMTPDQALEVIGKIWLEIPGHPQLQVCESIPQVQKAVKVLQAAVTELKKIKATNKENK